MNLSQILPGGPANTLRVLSAAIACGVSLTGCSTMEPSTATKPPAALQISEAVKQSGLSISTIALGKGQNFESYFGIEGPPSGWLVIYLKAQNTSEDAAWLIHKSQMRLASDEAGGFSLEPRGLEHRNKTAEGFATAGAILMSPLLTMTAGRAATDATVIRHNFAKHEWCNGTLVTNAIREGFVYFQLPTASPPPQRLVFHIEAIDLNSHRTNSVTAPISL